MIKAIDFAVRDSVGGRQQGSFAGPGQSNFIQLGAGDSISLNIAASSVVAYEQQGRDLVIKLADGRVVVLSGYFDGGQHHLYLSSNDAITEVMLTNDGSGVLAANYGPVQGFGKWSPLDDLRFSGGDVVAEAGPIVDEPAGMGLFVPALFAGGAGVGAAGLVGLGVIGAVAGGGGDDSVAGGDTGTGGGDTGTGGGDTGSGGGDTGSGGGDTGTGGGDTGTGGGDTGSGGGDTGTGGGDTGSGGGDTGTGGGDTGTGGGDTGTGGGDTGTGGGDTGTGGRRPPAVDNPNAEGTLTSNTPTPQVVVTGTGEPGDSVTVTIGDKEETTTIDADGTWGVIFDRDNLPGDGSYSTEVTVTEPGGTTHPLDGPDYIIDMTPPAVEFTAGTKSVGDLENLADYADGVTITGTGEPGATIKIEVEGHSREAVIGENGEWSFTFTQGEIAGGEREVAVTITATDPLGNRTVVTDLLVLDTIPHPVAIDPVTENNLVNEAENAAGVTLSGTTSPNTTLTLVVEANGTSITRALTSDASGVWNVTFPAGSLPAGSYDATASISTIDAAGNPSNTSHGFRVDTEIAVAIDATQATDNKVSGEEQAQGFTLTGTGEVGASITVVTTTLEGTLSHGPITVGSDGSWSVTYGPGQLPGGVYEASMVVTATDLAGNSTTDSHVLAVDTLTSVTIDAVQAGDNTISGSEQAAGITLTGTAEPFATMTVTFNGHSYSGVQADVAGNWHLPVPSANLPVGTTTATVSVTAVDGFGNSASASHIVNIDTEVVPLVRGSTSGGADGVINAEEASRGLTVTGTVEAGSSVSISFAGHEAIAAQVSGGVWSVTIPASQIPLGTTTADMVISATDRFGNTTSVSETVPVDREVTPMRPGGTLLAGDGYLNAAEAAQGLTVTGDAEPHSTLIVQILDGNTVLSQSVKVQVGADGKWSHTFNGTDLPRGEIDAHVVVQVTDRAGNTNSYNQSLVIDTEAPGAPDVIGFHRNATGLTGITTSEANESYEFSRVDGNGTVTEIEAGRSVNIYTGAQEVTFGAFTGNSFVQTTVPDGSYLVVDSTDIAGNQSSTLMIINNTNAPQIDLSRPGLTQFDFSAIDLSFAPDADLTITEAQILSLTGADRALVIKGDADDRVEIIGGVHSGDKVEIDGESYNIYTVGTSGATIYLDDDIQPL